MTYQNLFFKEFIIIIKIKNDKKRKIKKRKKTQLIDFSISIIG